MSESLQEATQHLLYPLQPKQRTFAETYAKYRLIGGAKWWWKSYVCRFEAVRQCLSRPWIKWLVLRRTLPEIYNNMILPMQVELLEFFDWKKVYDYNQNKNTLTFFNHQHKEMRSKIVFWFCRNQQDLTKYQGIEYDFICIEELTHWKYERFRELMWSLRTSKTWVLPNFFWSTNPGNIWHARVKRLFVDRDFTEYEKPEEYWFIPANVYDNVVLMENQPDYIDTLMALPEKLRKAFMEGDRNVFAGQFFEQYRSSIHEIEPYEPKIWVKRRIIMLDYWYSKHSAVYRGALMNDWSVVIYRELYVTEHTYEELLIAIDAMTSRDEEWKKETNIIIPDPAIVKKKSETWWWTFEEYAHKYWYIVKPWVNNRMRWRNNVRQYLQPLTDPNTNELTAMLKITKNCVHLIRTLPSLVHDKTKVEDVDTDQEDHGPDALRYWLLYLWERTSALNEIIDVNNSFKLKVMTKTAENLELRKQDAAWWQLLGMEF